MEIDNVHPAPPATKVALALKAARMTRHLSRKDAARICGCSLQAIEQLENGRKAASEARLRLITARIGISWEAFLAISADPQRHIADASDSLPSEGTLKRKPRRNEYKIITKEVRIVRSLRKRKGLSQSEASRLCEFGPQGFSFLEAGRVELTEKKVSHILKCFGLTATNFQELMAAPILRDELIDDLSQSLNKLSDVALVSISDLVKELSK